jgi:hypothetical protein
MSAVSKFTEPYSTFDPRIIPGCTLWLDAADESSVTLSGSNVTSWRDKSTTGNNATASSNWPTYLSATSGQNNKRVISFVSASTQSFTLTASSMPIGTSAFTMFIASKPTSNANLNVIMWGNNGIASQGIFMRYTSAFGSPGIGFAPGTTANQTTDSTTLLNTFNVFSGTCSGGASSLLVGWRSGNPFNSAGTTYSSNIGTAGAFIGRTIGASQYLNGTIGEIIIYNSALSTTDRQQVEGYLTWKWGVQTQLPVHPYSSYPAFMVPFRATDISNCYCWLDASDRSSFTIDGSNNVTAIIDKANGNSFTVGGTPTWSATGFNTSYPGFTMTNGRFIKTITTMTKYQHTVFIVTKLNSTPSAGWPCVAFAGAVGGSSEFYRVIDYITTPAYRTIAFTASLFSATTPYVNANLIFSGTFDGDRAITSRILRGTENNFSVSGTGTAFAGNAAAIMIGTDGFTPGTNTWPGVIAEVIVYGNSNLSATQIRVIEGYLAWKWGLRATIPTTHPFYNLPPLRVTA